MNKWLLKLSAFFFATYSLIVFSDESEKSEPSQATMYFDPVQGKLVSKLDPSKQTSRELLFQVDINRIILGELLVLEEDNQYWIDFAELLEVLGFPITYKPPLLNTADVLPDLQAEGWFIQESNNFELKTDIVDKEKIYRIQSKGQNFELLESQVMFKNQTLYFPLDKTLNWFDIDAQAEPNALSLTLTSAQRLPIEAKIQRRNRASNRLNSDFEVQFPTKDVPYQLFSPVFTDIQLNSRFNNDSSNRYGVSMLGAGDLAYMTGRYYISHNRTEGVEPNTNFSLSLERKSLESDLLGPLKATKVALGDISPTSISNISSSGSQVGIRVSNQPYGRITNSLTTSLTGLQQEGWDVELYQNNILVGSQTIGEDGQYQFLNQPLEVGENIFVLKFYGPQGQLEERSETYVLDPASLTGGGLIYDLSLTREQWSLSNYFDSENKATDDKYRVSLHLEKSINQTFSLTTDVSQFEFSDGSQHVFVQPGVRAFAYDTVFNASILKDVEAGSRSSFSASHSFGSLKRHKLNYSLFTSTEDFQLDAGQAARIKLSNSLGLSGRFRIGKPVQLNYQLRAGLTDYYSGSQEKSFLANFGANAGGIRFGNNLNYSETQSSGVEQSERLEGNAFASGRFKRIFLRSAYEYSLKPVSEPISAGISASWNFLPNLSTNWRYGYDFETEQFSQSYDFSWSHEKFVASLGLQEADGFLSGRLNFRFSLGHDPIKNELFMSGRRLSPTGALSALVYEDLNNNQVWEEGEPAIRNAQVTAVQQRRKAVTDEKGTALITGLYDSSITDIKVDEGTLEDPFWLPSQEGISFLPRPGLVKTLLIPVVTAGEVEGGIKLAQDLFVDPVDLNNVPLVLTNLENAKSYRTKSQYDGFYLFNKVAPGNYSLSIDPKFLERNELDTRRPMEIKIGHKGSLILGANFTLYPEGMYQPQKDASFKEGVYYSLDLGSFITEKNAKTVLSVLRGVFPELLSQYQNRTPYEVLLSKKADDQYQLVLGPFFDLNQPKYVCGALATENLHCRIQKNAVETPEQAPAEKTASVSALPAVSQPNSSAKTTPVANTPLVQEDLLADKSHEKPASKPVAAPQPQLAADEGFTIQLVSVSSRTAAKGFIERYRLKQTQIEPKTVNGREMFAVLVGQFASRAEAKEAAGPIEVHTGKAPWVRPMAL